MLRAKFEGNLGWQSSRPAPGFPPLQSTRLPDSRLTEKFAEQWREADPDQVYIAMPILDATFEPRHPVNHGSIDCPELPPRLNIELTADEPGILSYMARRMLVHMGAMWLVLPLSSGTRIRGYVLYNYI